MDTDVYPNSRVVDLASKSLLMVKINVDKQPAVAKKYGVESIPTIIFMNKKGKPVHAFIGAVSVSEMLGHMRAALKAH